MSSIQSYPTLGIGFDKYSIVAQTKRFTVVAPAKHTPGYSEIRGNVERIWNNPNWGTVTTIGRLFLDKLTNGIGNLFGKTSQHRVSVFPGGHTYNVDAPGGQARLQSEFDQIKKVSGFQQSLLVHGETAVIWGKLWIGKLLQFITPPESGENKDIPV